MRARLQTLALITFIVSVASVPAAAADYARYSCSELWVARNQIYKDAGYCFKTSRAIRYFGNSGCQFDVQTDVPLSRIDRREIDEIVRVEAYKGCSN